MKKALMLCGGWDGHEPELTSRRFSAMLKKHGYVCETTRTLETLENLDTLLEQDLIVACAEKYLYRDYWKDPRWENAAAAEDEAYRALKGKTNRRLSVGRVLTSWR